LIDLPALGFGCAPIGGLFEPVGDERTRQTLQHAWEAGLRFFDTAPLYGLGLAERRLGSFLKDKPRDEYVLSTKVGRIIRDGTPGPDLAAWTENRDKVFDFDFSYDGVMRSVEASLERLDLDRVDILFIHDPDDHHDEAIDGAYRALDLLRHEGTIGALGAGMNQTQMLARFAREASFDCFLVAGRYTLLDRSADAELFPLCEERGVVVVAGGVFNSGLLAGGDTYDYAPASEDLRRKVRELNDVCFRYGVPLKAAALQFPYRQPVVASVLTGARTPNEIDENARLFGLELPPELWAELDAVR
jgi:D-threo-aldose 1-dehydrogenase